MPRRQKPPGREKWTWDEINAGRKMSKGEKRSRRLANQSWRNKGATRENSAPRLQRQSNLLLRFHRALDPLGPRAHPVSMEKMTRRFRISSGPEVGDMLD